MAQKGAILHPNHGPVLIPEHGSSGAQGLHELYVSIAIEQPVQQHLPPGGDLEETAICALADLANPIDLHDSAVTGWAVSRKVRLPRGENLHC